MWFLDLQCAWRDFEGEVEGTKVSQLRYKYIFKGKRGSIVGYSWYYGRIFYVHRVLRVEVQSEPCFGPPGGGIATISWLATVVKPDEENLPPKQKGANVWVCRASSPRNEDDKQELHGVLSDCGNGASCCGSLKSTEPFRSCNFLNALRALGIGEFREQTDYDRGRRDSWGKTKQ